MFDFVNQSPLYNGAEKHLVLTASHAARLGWELPLMAKRLISSEPAPRYLGSCGLLLLLSETLI